MTKTLKKYTLSLSPDYVLSWGFWEAVRELLQNAIDQKHVSSESEIRFEYDDKSETLIVGSSNCHLTPRTLLLGVSDKQSKDKLIGKFGEGYKLALLVLTRLSYEVIIYNQNFIWVPKIEYSTEYNEHILVIYETLAPDPVDGVYFHIRDVSDDNFGKIVENYLPKLSSNCILEEEYLRKKIFVNGLFVCEIKELEYGYNFSPNRIRLDRDRQMAPTFEISWEASRLWEAHEDVEKIYDNLEKDILDVRHVNYIKNNKDNYIVQRFLRDHPDTIPVSSQTEIDRLRGNKTCVVPSPLRDLLRRMHAFVFNRQGTPTERIEGFYHLFKNQLNSEAQREMEAILNDSKKWINQ